MKYFKRYLLLLVITCCLFIPRGVKAGTVLADHVHDNTLDIPSVAPTNFGEFYDYISAYFMINFDNVAQAYPSEPNADWTQCKVTVDYKDNTSETLSGLTINYTASHDAYYNKITQFKNSLPDNFKFHLTDLETINYWVHAVNEEDRHTDAMANYSSELKNKFGNSNIKVSYRTATGAGQNLIFSQVAAGDGVLLYNNKIYAMLQFVSGIAGNVIYVPDGTTDLKAAAQARIDAYIGEGIVTITDGGTLASIVSTEQEIEEEFGEMGLDMDPTGITNYYVATVNEVTHPILIIADSSKMTDPPKVRTTDMDTNISISTDKSTVPLDSSINSKVLTSGTEYNRINGVISGDKVVFDISLYSESIGDYVTELEDGTFEVRVPVGAEFAGKDITIYFVKENGETEEHTVTPDGDGFVKFTTNHFSTYTLTEKLSAASTTTTNNPVTADKIFLYITLLVLSTIGVSYSAKAIYERRHS